MHMKSKAGAMFILCSLIGIFVFFIKIDIGGNSRIPVDHLIAGLKGLISEHYAVIILLLTGYAIIQRILTKKINSSKTDIFFFVQSVLGFILCSMVVLGCLPEAVLTVIQSAVSATGNILCAIFLTSLFIPFLTEYGLVDFVGVICEPFMRRVFQTPGSSAVIGVSAFLGNYSMGHVISKQMYDEEKFTEKESVIVAIGFSTCSIGLMINLVNYLDLMEYWTIYVLSVLIVTFGTTILTARIPPISRKKNVYRSGRPLVVQTVKTERLLHRAVSAGVEKAAEAPELFYSIKNILKRVFPIICEITGTSIFIIPAGMLLAEYTGVFRVIGGIFYPLLMLVGVDAEYAVQCMGSLGASILEPVLAGVIADGTTWPLFTRWIVAIVPYSAIVFFAGFIPSLWKSGISCKIHEMIFIWLQRVVVGILISAGLAYLFMAVGLLG